MYWFKLWVIWLVDLLALNRHWAKSVFPGKALLRQKKPFFCVRRNTSSGLFGINTRKKWPVGEHRSPARLKASTENQRKKALQFFPPSLTDKWFLGSEGHEHSPFEHVVFYRVISVLPTNPISKRCIVLNAPPKNSERSTFCLDV